MFINDDSKAVANDEMNIGQWWGLDMSLDGLGAFQTYNKIYVLLYLFNLYRIIYYLMEFCKRCKCSSCDCSVSQQSVVQVEKTPISSRHISVLAINILWLLLLVPSLKSSRTPNIGLILPCLLPLLFIFWSSLIFPDIPHITYSAIKWVTFLLRQDWHRTLLHWLKSGDTLAWQNIAVL